MQSVLRHYQTLRNQYHRIINILHWWTGSSELCNQKIKYEVIYAISVIQNIIDNMKFNLDLNYAIINFAPRIKDQIRLYFHAKQ